MDMVKSFFEEIKKHRKYIYLIIFIFIGTMMFYGLSTSGPHMRNTAESFLNKFDVEDIKLVSSHGIAEEDLTLMDETIDASAINVGYQMDVGIEGTNNLISVESIPESWVKFDLKEGRFPENSGEIAVDEDLEDFPYDIGDTISLVPKGNNPMMRLKLDTYTIVGKISSPEYIYKNEKGLSNFTGSSLDGYALIIPEDFDLERPNFARIHLNSTENLSYFSNNYKATVDNASYELRVAFADMPEKKHEIVVTEASSRIEESQNQIKDLENQRTSRTNENEEEIADLEKQKENYRNKKEEYDTSLEESQALLEDGDKRLETLEEEVALLEENQSGLQGQYDSQLAVVNSIYAEYEPIKTEYENLQSNIDQRQADVNEEYSNINTRLANISTEIGDLRRELATARLSNMVPGTETTNIDAINNSIASLEAERDTLEARVDQLYDIQAQIDSDYGTLANLEGDYNSLQAEYSSANASLSEYEASLADVNEELEVKSSELNQLQEDIDKANTFMNEEKEPMENELADLEEEIKATEQTTTEKTNAYNTFMKESENEISRLQAVIKRSEEERDGKVMPSYDIESTSDNMGMNLYSSITNRVDMMTSVFPVIVLALCVFSAGGLYNSILLEKRSMFKNSLSSAVKENTSVFIKILVTTLIAIILGLIGAVILSFAIFRLYGESFIFEIPNFKIFPIHLLIVILSFLLAFALAVLVRYLDINFDFKTSLNSSSLNNLINHPVRLIGSILGVAVCVGLIFTGLSLSRSLRNLSNIQYGNIVKYHAQIALPDNVDSNDTDDFDFFLTDVKNARDVRNVATYNSDTQMDGYPSVNFDLIIPDRIEDFSNQMNLRSLSGEELAIPEEGIIISQKIAEINNLKVGDTVNFTIGDSTAYEAEIKGIFQNYISDFAYMSPAFFESLTSNRAEYNQKNVVLVDSSAYAVENFVNDALEYDYVQNINTVFEAKAEADNIIRPLNFIAILYIVVAAILLLITLILQTRLVTDNRLDEIFGPNHLLIGNIQFQHFLQTIIGLIIGLALGSFSFSLMTSKIVNDNIRITSNVYWLDYAITAIALLVLIAFLYVSKSSQYSQYNEEEAES